MGLIIQAAYCYLMYVDYISRITLIFHRVFGSRLFVIKHRRDESHTINSPRDCHLSAANDR